MCNLKHNATPGRPTLSRLKNADVAVYSAEVLRWYLENGKVQVGEELSKAGSVNFGGSEMSSLFFTFFRC